ncbi:tetratricopeptide TPR_2 repeat protein [Nitrosococcus watsonii C-113]|uniref:Tetratricopeptide TPR_2 repeat protein n=2 Tax=Nitrosococcus TaxID=1227 RepID=D8K7F7_NITWC|nr:tetratricopeptide TPR_2 repeat protein [Nitrosococcus watsonii C-113]
MAAVTRHPLPQVKVQEQADLVQGGGKLLQTLDSYIHDHCNAVIHLVGREGGQPLKPDEVRWLLDTYGDFAERFPWLAPALHASPPTLTYTQMEAWLALYHRKRCHLYQPSTWDQNPLPAGHLQQRHWEWLKKLGEHRGTFDDGQHLCRRVLRDLHNLWPGEIPQHCPLSLPYASLGTLFKGRKAFLQQLHTSLTKATGKATAVVGKTVHGLGGVGKTRLAVEYAWQHRDEYSAVLFVTADSPTNLQRNLAELSGPLVLNLPERESPEEAVQMAAALRWLNTHPGWLLILDNVDTEEAASYAEDLLTRLQGGQVLITSRLARWGDQVEPLELDVLEEDAAAALLLERTAPQNGGRGRKPLPDDDQHAVALARELDGLALALEQAGAYIAAQRISLADYLRRWQAHDQQVQTWYRAREMKYPRSVAVTWQTTLEQLGPGEVALLNILAWFAPEPIPLFALGLPCTAVHFDPEENLQDAKVAEKIAALWREAAARLWNAEPPAGSAGNGERADSPAQAGQAALREALATLADYCMIRWEVAADTVTVHRVVQEILRSRQPQPTCWLSLALRLVGEAQQLAGHPQDVRTWPRWEPLRAHIAFAATAAGQSDIAAPTATLLNNLAQLLHAKALFTEAEPLCRRALAIEEAAYGPDHPTVATGLNNLAELLRVTHRLTEAEPLFRRMAAIYYRSQQTTGHAHPHMQPSLENYRHLLHASGVPPDDIEQRLQTAMQTPGPLEPITPEIERLLGPTQPVPAVLAALDEPYRREHKPAVWFLPLTEPIAPHLEALLGPSQIGLPLDQPVASHLEKLLGPAPSTQDVLNALDRQYREQGKPPVWFLPLGEPISPHLHELLGPIKETKQA